MISRIRVETRATSMEDAEREAELFLDHARAAGFFEGITPVGSRLTDHHFGRVIQSPGEFDEWSKIGFDYEGRITHTFDAEPTKGGGLKQFGRRVIQFDEQLLPSEDADRGKVLTDDVIVLDRRNPVTRENSWDDGHERLLDYASGLPRPTATDYAAFSAFAQRPEILEVAFGPAKRRDGYEIDVKATIESTATPSGTANDTTMTVGAIVNDTFFGETFGDAIAAASAALDQARASLIAA